MSGWTDSFYTNPTLMRAEELLINRFAENWHPMTMKEMLELTGLTERAMQRVLGSIRRYPGYTVEMSRAGVSRHNPNGACRWQIIYQPELDPWINIGVKYAYQAV